MHIRQTVSSLSDSLGQQAAFSVWLSSLPNLWYLLNIRLQFINLRDPNVSYAVKTITSQSYHQIKRFANVATPLFHTRHFFFSYFLYYSQIRKRIGTLYILTSLF